MTMPNSKNGKRTRPKPTLQELNEINDKLLQELVLLYKESISHAVQNNISIEDDHVSPVEICVLQILQVERHAKRGAEVEASKAEAHSYS